MANRHLARTVAMQSLFEWDFNNRTENLAEIIETNLVQFAPGLEETDFSRVLANGVKDNMEALDKIIVETAPEWPIDQITVVDRSVLRLGIYELLFLKDVPPKVAINEAVEIAKAFGGENSGKFVNGVLGTLYKNKIEPEDTDQRESLVKEVSDNDISSDS